MSIFIEVQKAHMMMNGLRFGVEVDYSKMYLKRDLCRSCHFFNLFEITQDLMINLKYSIIVFFFFIWSFQR